VAKKTNFALMRWIHQQFRVNIINEINVRFSC